MLTNEALLRIYQSKLNVVDAKLPIVDHDDTDAYAALIFEQSLLNGTIYALSKQSPMKIDEVHCDEYFCPSCGSENNCDEGKVDDRYCPNCGQRLSTEGTINEY